MNFLALFRHGVPRSARAVREPPPHVAVADDYPGLRRIHEPEINLAIWRRGLPAELRHWLDKLPYAQLPQRRVMIGPHEHEAVVRALVTENLAAVPPVADALVADITGMIKIFRDLSGYETLQLRLEGIDNASCKKFHTDHVGLRLLVTYKGAGTQWLPEHAVDRLALGCCENHDICRNRGAVETLERGHAAILKGSAYRPAAVGGIVHRSPPIKEKGRARLLLCLDKPYCHTGRQ